MMKPVSELLS